MFSSYRRHSAPYPNKASSPRGGKSPAEFSEALELARSGAIDWRSLVTGKVGLDGVTKAFAAMTDPEAHAKVLIDPWRDGGL